MSLGLVGRKVGMTRIFAEDGRSIPVTVLDVSDNRVSQIKTSATDGYAAVQIAYGKRRASRITKPVAGHLAKAGVEPCRGMKEFRIAEDQLSGFNAGDAIGADLFQVGQKVDVTGVSIGKGFSGVIKRHNFSSQRASCARAQSQSWRVRSYGSECGIICWFSSLLSRRILETIALKPSLAEAIVAA